MRKLSFIVNGQVIEKDPKCDFSNLFPGAGGLIEAEFSFSTDWDGCSKVAAFFSPLGKEYPPRVLADGKTCVIPFPALEKRSFKIQILGKKGGERIKTNKVVVNQNGGKK